MNKILKRSLITVAAVGAVVAVGLATTTVVNITATAAESGKIVNYGERVPVEGGRMNVLTVGDGPQTIVMIPGFGTATPVLDFDPLARDLARDHRVVIVEPLGYGLSDGTDRERTTENIVSEVHSALEALHIDRYALMGHSIAGIYSLAYTERYPDEVTAFIGIDSSVPGQPGMDAKFPIGLLATAKNLGLNRLAGAAGDGYNPDAYSEDLREQITLLSNRNSLSPTYLDEMDHIRTNFAAAVGTGFPEDLPVLLFVEAENAKNPDWIGLHERQAAAVADGTVIPVAGEHYLHHTHATQIAAEFRQWEAARPALAD